MNALITPVLIVILLTFLVWLNMFVRRLSASSRLKLDPQQMATPEQLTELMDDRANAASNCFKNMLEMPVIFYVVCILIMFTGKVDALYLNMAWGVVIGRALQAMVHCTYNKVMHRFIAYLVSSALIWAMVIRFTMSVL